MTPEHRYLQLLKSTLLNDLYLETEVRLLYVLSLMETKREFNPDVLRNIRTSMQKQIEHVRSRRNEGMPCWEVSLTRANGTSLVKDFRNLCEFSHTMVGRKRLDNIEACLKSIKNDSIPGDIIETGVWRGGASIFMKGCLAANGMDDRTVWVADSFEGLPVPSLPQDAGYDYSANKVPILAISLEEVQENFRRYDLLDENVKFLKGWFRDTLADAPIEKLSLLRLDGDLYESTMDALNALYHKVSPGGFVIVDDYGDFEPCRRAVDEFRSRYQIDDPIEKIDWAGSYWRKSR